MARNGRNTETENETVCSLVLALSYSSVVPSARRNGTLGNGQKSCDDYGFIQCVKRLLELRRSYSGRQAGRQAGGIVAPRVVTAATAALFVMP